MKFIKSRLALLNFLEFAVWGAYLTSLGAYLDHIGQKGNVGYFYMVQGIVSMFMPAIIGIIADRWVQAQRLLGYCHILAGSFMAAAWYYAFTAATVEFWPLFSLYTLSVVFFMPTIGLANSVNYSTLNRAGLDTVKHFPPIRTIGTVGFICLMLFTNFTGFQNTESQLLTSGVLSFLLALYTLTCIPTCPVKGKAAGSVSIVEALGLNAFKLFKDKQMAIFFIFSMLLGVSLQITNGFANMFIQNFQKIGEYAGTWGAKNANALISLSQMSETLCILLIPFFLKRFGIKVVMLMSMFAWVFRFGLFGVGDPGSGVVFFILSMIVYGVAFDFFNVSGSLFVDLKTDESMRSSAQGLFMLMTNGIGATIGTFGAQKLLDHLVFLKTTPDEQIAGWRAGWYIFAGYALVVAVMFWILFRYKHTSCPTKAAIRDAEEQPTI